MKKITLIILLLIGCSSGQKVEPVTEEDILRIDTQVNAKMESDKRSHENLIQTLENWKNKPIIEFIKLNGVPTTIIKSDNGGKVYFYQDSISKINYSRYRMELINIEKRQKIILLNAGYPDTIDKVDPYTVLPRINYMYTVESIISLTSNKKGIIVDYSYNER